MIIARGRTHADKAAPVWQNRRMLRTLLQDRRSRANREVGALGVRSVATFLLRLSQVLGALWSPLGQATKSVNHVLTGLDAAWEAKIGPGLVLYHPTGVVIGPDVVLGRDCEIHSCVTLGSRGGRSMPTVGDEVQIGAGARLLGPIQIGDRARIGANAVVLADVPAGASAVGVPAQVRLPVG